MTEKTITITCTDDASAKENASQSAQDLAYVHTFQLDDVLASIGRFADAGGPDQHISMLAGMGRKMLAEIQETLAVQFENRVGETNDQNEEVTP